MTNISLECFGYPKYALATPVKVGAEAMLGVPFEVPDDQKEVDDRFLYSGSSPRLRYQALGTKRGRGIISQDIRVDWAKRIAIKVDQTDAQEFPTQADSYQTRGGSYFLHGKEREAGFVDAANPANVCLQPRLVHVPRQQARKWLMCYGRTSNKGVLTMDK